MLSFQIIINYRNTSYSILRKSKPVKLSNWTIKRSKQYSGEFLNVTYQNSILEEKLRRVFERQR
jgi:hypothetical protein